MNSAIVNVKKKKILAAAKEVATPVTAAPATRDSREITARTLVLNAKTWKKV